MSVERSCVRKEAVVKTLQPPTIAPGLKTKEQGRVMDDLRANGYTEVLFKVSQSHYSFWNHT